MSDGNETTRAVLLGEFHRTRDGALDGWCWYPDQPEERAVVELLINGEVARAARATRFLQNRRDLGTGDGYCGFWFPVPSELDWEDGRYIIEVRERRFQQVFGRIVLGGPDRSGEIRLDAIKTTLKAIGRTLEGVAEPPTLGAPLRALGETLLHAALRPQARETAEMPELAASLERIAAIPKVDLGWCRAPHVSVIVPITDNPLDLAATLRDASRALVHFGAEFILLDDGMQPLTALLPTRLRALQLVRHGSAGQRASALNAAAAVARGAFLAFADTGGPGLAGLDETIRDARDGTLHLASYSGNGMGVRRHRLLCLVGREDFFAMGGFDPSLEDEAMWLDLVDKADALGMTVKTWPSPHPPRSLASVDARHA